MSLIVDWNHLTKYIVSHNFTKTPFFPVKVPILIFWVPIALGSSAVSYTILSDRRGAYVGQEAEGGSLHWLALCQKTAHLFRSNPQLKAISRPTFSEFNNIIIKTVTPPGHCPRRCRLWEVQIDQLPAQFDNRYPSSAW